MIPESWLIFECHPTINLSHSDFIAYLIGYPFDELRASAIKLEIQDPHSRIGFVFVHSLIPISCFCTPLPFPLMYPFQCLVPKLY
jgi:hypothetical protein